MLLDRPQITETSQLINATVASGATEPSSPSVGELFYNTTANLKVYANYGSDAAMAGGAAGACATGTSATWTAAGTRFGTVA